MYSVQDVMFKQNYCNLLAVAHCPLSIGRHLNHDSYKNNLKYHQRTNLYPKKDICFANLQAFHKVRIN